MKVKKIVILGYGNQGKAQALNLKESGVNNLVIGLRKGSLSRKKAKADGFKVMNISAAAKWADVVVVLIPDLCQKHIYEKYLKENMREGASLVFAHGLNIHFKMIKPRKDLDVFMVAPKIPGFMVRQEYKEGRSFPCLVAVHQDASGKAKNMAMSYSRLIGCKKSLSIQTTFKDECETDLFGEQAVLCGGLIVLMKKAFDTLVKAGYSKELAYFECIHEVKLIADLVYEGGMMHMYQSVSRVAEYGGMLLGSKIIDKEVQEKMNGILKDVQSGKFIKRLLKDNEKGNKKLIQMKNELKAHDIEKVGKKIRSKIPWICKTKK